MNECLRDLFDLINVKVNKEQPIDSLTQEEYRTKFKQMVDHVLDVDHEAFIYQFIKAGIKRDLIERFGRQRIPKSPVSNIDMIERTIRCKCTPKVRKMVRPGRLYQKLDNLVYDFGSFHVFYTLKCLFEDMDAGIRIDHAPTAP